MPWRGWSAGADVRADRDTTTAARIEALRHLRDQAPARRREVPALRAPARRLDAQAARGLVLIYANVSWLLSLEGARQIRRAARRSVGWLLLMGRV